MSEPASPVVSVVLVNFNDRPHLDACLEAVRAGDPAPSREIILVDNASTDGSVERFAERHPGVRLISNASNAGFAKACNQAARQGRGEFLLFLNTDTVMSPGTPAALVDSLRRSPRAAAAGPALLHGPGRFQVSFGKRVDFAAQIVQKFFLNPFHKARLPRARKERETGWLSAACLLVRREAFHAVGGFDENFFIYFEDIDLCVRLRSAAWTLLYVPRARVLHEGGATTAPRPGASRMEYRRSQVYFYGKHNSPVSLGLLRVYLRLATACQWALGRFRGPEGRARLSAYRSLLKKGHPAS